MSSYTISCLGFDAPQQDSIAAILALASSALNDTWHFADTLESDMVFINMDADNGTRNLSERRMLLPDYRIILVAPQCDDNMKGFWFLNKKPGAPPSLKATVNLLNQVAVCLSQAQENAADIAALDIQENEGSIANSNDVQQILNLPKAARKLLPKNYLFGTILQAESDNNCRIIKLKQLPPLYLSPKENTYYFSGTESELLYFHTASPKLFRIQSSVKLELKKAEKNIALLTKKPLSVLKANSILYASQGRLLEEHSPEWEVKLIRLPNYEEMPVLEKYKDIADYMSEQETNLYSVAEALNMPLADVFDFYNVCYLFGHIKAHRKESGARDAKNVIEVKNDKTLGHFLKFFFKKGDKAA